MTKFDEVSYRLGDYLDLAHKTFGEADMWKAAELMIALDRASYVPAEPGWYVTSTDPEDGIPGEPSPVVLWRCNGDTAEPMTESGPRLETSTPMRSAVLWQDNSPEARSDAESLSAALARLANRRDGDNR